MKILMVCIGNICRSPMAEGIMREKIKEHGLQWEVDSAGISAFHIGEPPHKSAQKVAREHDIDLSNQEARPFETEDFENFDVIYAMESSVLSTLNNSRTNTPSAPSKIMLLLNESCPGEDLSVPDPWYGGEDGFYEAWDLIAEACDRIVEKYS